MNETLRDHTIVDRYLIAGEGWRTKSTELRETTLDAAWHVASQHAHDLDTLHGDSHFWTVDLDNPQGESYVQLFHGRLS